MAIWRSNHRFKSISRLFGFLNWTWEGGVRVPGIAYWKGMIKPGRASDDVFDLMDLFNTAMHLAGAEERIPADRYINGVDQTSFLLDDEGAGNRECVFFWYKS
mgnify:CR=1 FL=1